MNLEAYEHALVDVLFKKDFAKSLELLGGDERERHRWRVYRRMARTRLSDAVEASFPRLFQLVEAAPLVERWLDESPPRSPYLRDVAGEFSRWLRPELLPSPPFALALAAYEWLRLEVAFAHEEEGAADVHEARELSFERPAVLTPAHRIVHTTWAVHRIAEEIEDPSRLEVAEGSFALCVYRDPATLEVRVLELSPIAAAILEEVASGERSVVESVRRAQAREPFEIDGPFISAFADLVADLIDRGVWLGSK